MLWNSQADLITVTTTTNDVGDAIEQEAARTVYANKLSVRQSEFYQSMQTGLRPELMFEVWTSEYDGETKLRHGGKDYTVIRTFDRTDEKTELIVTGTVGE